eukprot:6491654-Amphidinium_carterae.1
MSERNFYFINTFLPPTSSPLHQNPTSDITQQALTTWRMPKRKCHNIAKQYQIDFIICNHSATRATSNCCTMEWETFSTVHTSDHRPVQATLLLDTKPNRPTHTPRTLTRFTDNEHKQKYNQHFAELCKEFYNDPCTAACSPESQLRQLELIAYHSMEATHPPNTAKPSSPWIQRATLDTLTELNALRKLKAAFHMDHNFQPEVAIYRHRNLSLLLHDIFHFSTSPNDSLLSAINTRRRTVRQQLRSDKKEWIATICQEAETARHHHDVKRLYHQVRRLQKTQRKLTFQLQNSNGTIHHDCETLTDMWLQHWSKHFDAPVEHNLPFLRKDIKPHLQLPVDAQVPIFTLTSTQDTTHRNEKITTTPHQVQLLLSRLKGGKSTPNLLPTDAWKMSSEIFAKSMTSYFNNIITSATLPQELGGSTVIPILKAGKTPTKGENFRPIQLLSIQRKTLGQILLRELKNRTKTADTQYCVGDCAGIDQPHLIISHLIAHQIDTKQAGAFIMCDLSSAYDSIIHDLLFPPQHAHQNQFTKMLLNTGTTHDTANRVHTYLHNHPDALINQCLPPELDSLLRQWAVTWMILPEHWRRYRNTLAPHGKATEWTIHEMTTHLNTSTATHPSIAGLPTLTSVRGLKQGDALSTMLFCSYLNIAILQADEQIQQSMQHFNLDATPRLPLPFGRDFLEHNTTNTNQPCSVTRTEDISTVAIPHIEYADDIIYPLQSTSNTTVIKALHIIIDTIITSFTHFGLTLNTAHGKTNILLRLTGKDAPGIWQHLKNESATQSLHGNSTATA